MSVKIRERCYAKTNTVTWQADIHVKLIDGRKIRERSKVPGARSRGAALKWALERERWLILHGHETTEEEQPRDEMPTLAQFAARFMVEYVIANRLKPSTVENKRMMLGAYLLPQLGERPLDKISEVDIQRLKSAFSRQATSSVNNILTLLSTMLKVAVEWGVIDSVPKIRKLKRQPQGFEFYEEATFESLVEAASRCGVRSLLVVLLGGDAGLRAGEIIALRLPRCDLRRGVLNVAENDWRGHVGLPKGGRARQVVMTARLRAALASVAALRGGSASRVILREDGSRATRRAIDYALYRAQSEAGLPRKGPHVLRHTFCSRLAARGASPKAIQELAGHVHSSTTDRYLHLAPSALKTAIELLDS
ncbi:MAG: tyrosine-type recombinase/integrase family protein [Myxococcales bacterium]|nr:tyrosine-type recombinase/integrase family protein [Myxococcales bacterium]